MKLWSWCCGRRRCSRRIVLSTKTKCARTKSGAPFSNLGTSKLSDIFGPVFEIGLEVGHEFARVSSVDNAVIEAESEALDGTDRDGVVAVLVGKDFGFLVQAADAEDCALRLVDDGGCTMVAEDTVGA